MTDDRRQTETLWHWHCVSDDKYTYYYSNGIVIVSVMTDTHITILMTLCQWWQIHILLFWWHCVSDDRYTHYFSDDIVSEMTDTHIIILMTLCQWWQIRYTLLFWWHIHTLLFWWHWHCVSDDRYTYYYSDGIGIVSVMTDTHITILMVLAFFSDDRYTKYYSDDIGIVSVMTDTHNTILMALTLCQWWQIHILLFWWHWHCVHDNRYIDYYSDRYFMPKIYSGPNRISLVCQKNLKREIRWNYFGHNKLFRHLILLPGLVYKADHTP